MANDIIKKSDISVKDPAGNLRKSLEFAKNEAVETIKTIEDLLKINKKLLDQNKRPTNIKQIKELNSAIEDTESKVSDLNAVQKASIKITKQLEAAEINLIAAEKEEAKEIAELNRRKTKQNQLNKDESILNSKLTGTIEKLSASTRILKKERNALNLETEEGAKQLIKLNSIIDENDAKVKENVSSLEQQKIEIGGYKDAIKDALGETDEFTGSLGGMNEGAQQGIVLFKKLFTSLVVVKKAEDNTAKGAKKLGRALKASGIAIIVATVASLGAAFTKTREGQLKFARTIGLLEASLGVLIGSLSNAGLGIIGIGESLVQFLGGNFSQAADTAKEAIGKLTGAFDDFGERVKANVKNNDELIISTFEHIDAVRQLEREISNLQAREELQQAIADDATKSFADREDAIKRSINLTEERIEKQLELARTEIEHANERLRIELREAGTLEISNDQLKDLINNEELRGKVSEAALEKQQDAILGLIESENELLLIQKEQDKVVSELKQDRLEKDLDILIDGFDNVKTINEQLIADESKTLEARAAILAETNRLSDISFKSQKDTLQEFSESIIDFNDLINESDAEALNQKIRNLGLSEIIEGRLLEVIRERRTVTQDLTVAERELTEAFKDRADAQEVITQAIDNELKAGELAAAKRTGDTETEFRLRRQVLIDQAFFETNLQAETADEKTLIEEKLKNDLAALDAEKAKSVEDKNKKILESEQKLQDEREQIQDARLSTAKNVLGALGDLADEESEAQRVILAAQKLAAISEIVINKNREISSIAAEKTDNETLKRSKILEAKTRAAAGIISVLSTGFHDAGYTGDGGEYDVAGFVHKGEMVQTAKQTTKYGMKGWSANDFDKKVSEGHFNQFADGLMMSPHAFKAMELGNPIRSQDINYKALLVQSKAMEESIVKAIERNKSTSNIDFNGLGELIRTELRAGVKQKSLYKKDNLL